MAKVLIYVFDVQSRELEKDFHYYQSCLSSIAEVLDKAKRFSYAQNSKNAKVFCLCHKMDLIPEDQREQVSASAPRC